MSKAQLRAVNPEIEHPRDTARKAVKRWRSNAEKEKLAVANQIDSGAPSLRTDEVLEKAYADLIGKK